MIRAVLKSKIGRPPVVLLGLDPENLVRLGAGQPIVVTLHHLAGPDRAPVDELPEVMVAIFLNNEVTAAIMEAADPEPDSALAGILSAVRSRMKGVTR